MAIKTGLEQAKENLILPTGTEEAFVDNAKAPALADFRDRYKRYDLIKLNGETFDSISVEDLGNDIISVELAPNVIKKMFVGYALRIDSGSYLGHYPEVLTIDTTTNKITFKIYIVFVNETITFFNYEWQLYEMAFSWFICSYCRFTLQKLKECKVMVSSSQAGDGSIEAYSTKSIKSFQRDLKATGEDLMLTRYYPKGY